MRNVLLLEDNKEINKFVRELLESEGYNVFFAFNVLDALSLFRGNNIDLIITDLMLPLISGEYFIEEIRKISNVHILAVTAKTQVADKIKVLKLGADDFITKPFISDELVIKINNYFSKLQNSVVKIKVDDVTLNFRVGVNQLIVNEEIINLTAIEYTMMKLLVDNHPSVLSREQFMDYLYSLDMDVNDRVIDVHIRNIRKKLKKEYDKVLIKTIYGFGYTWVGDLDE